VERPLLLNKWSPAHTTFHPKEQPPVGREEQSKIGIVKSEVGSGVGSLSTPLDGVLFTPTWCILNGPEVRKGSQPTKARKKGMDERGNTALLRERTAQSVHEYWKQDTSVTVSPKKSQDHSGR
jgi:hypothetical protein